jgi:hypothetical protein
MLVAEGGDKEPERAGREYPDNAGVRIDEY